MSDVTAEYWKLLRLTEDYFDGQTRSEREYTVPALRSRTPAEETAREPGGDAASTEPPREQPDSSAEALAAIGDEVSRCRLCRLCRGRTTAVPGEGVPNPEVMVIGEGPGANEDRQGEPFVGRAGRLLNAMLLALGLAREEVFITNTVKCRPPGNRDPEPAETERCGPFLDRQIELVEPRVILAVGRVAAQIILDTNAPLARLRGREHRYPRSGRHVPVIATYHPAYLLRKPSDKRAAWEDLCLARSIAVRSP